MKEKTVDPRLEKLRGKLCVFEGHDLTGKSSVSKLLAQILNANDIKTVWTFQPGDAAYGEHGPVIRSLCKDKKYDMHPLANYFIFLADKVEVCSKVVKPALEAGKTVISDRWSYSTVAYQIDGRGIGTLLGQYVWMSLDDHSVLGLKPDFVFYFPERLKVDRPKDAGDQWETAGDSFMKKVQDSYEEQADQHGWLRVHPGHSVEETLENLLDLLS